MPKDQMKGIAYWIMGTAVPHYWAPGIALQLADGFPGDNGYLGMRSVRIDDPQSYDTYDATNIDGTIEIRYTWRFLGLKMTKSFRAIGAVGEGPMDIRWKSIPRNDPPISDPHQPGGFITQIDVKENWGATMENRDFHP